MTNLQSGAPQGPDPALQRLLVLAPALVGGLLAAGAMAALGWPTWQQVLADQRRVEELRALEQQLPALRQQLETQRRRSEMVAQRQRTLLELIAGSGSLSTFLSEVDRLAAGSGVRLDLYEPASAATPNPGAPQAASPLSAQPVQPGQPSQPGGPSRAAAQPADPLLAQGLEKRSLMLMAKGNAPQLLAFLRRLEGLSVLVVQSDLNLALEDIKAAQPQPAAPSANAPQPQAPGAKPVEKKPPTWVALKLSVSLYEKSAARGARPAAAGAPR